MSTALQRPKRRTITPAELRVRLKQSGMVGNKEKFLRSVLGCMSEEEAAVLERRINEMNERVDEKDKPLV